jgi:hypothetical protein
MQSGRIIFNDSQLKRRMIVLKKGMLLLLILLCVIGGGIALSAGVSLGVIEARCSQQADYDQITFTKTFTTTPVIVVSAQTGFHPLAAAAVNNTTTGFRLALYDLNGNRVTNSNNVWVQWVAITPNPGVAVRANCQYLSDGTTVTYSNIGATYPVAVCSAQYGATPLLAAAMNTSATSFTLTLKDLNGNPATGWVQYIVINPGTDVNYYQEASILSGCSVYSNWSHILFNLTRYPDGIVCSGQVGLTAIAAGASENQQDGFLLNQADHAGNPVTAWTSWLAVGMK